MIFNRNKQHGESNERRETVSLPRQGAETLRAHIDMSVGSLVVRGGAATSEALHGDLIMHRDIDVEVDQRMTEDRCDVSVRQIAPPSRLRGSHGRNVWNIALNDQLPTDLRVKQSTGDADLHLSTASLTRLVVERSTGEVTVDLSGEHRQLNEVSVDSSTGKTTLNLTGQFDHLDTLRVSGSVGQIGVDLRGAWGKDLDGRITTSTGSVLLQVPMDVGVEVIASTSIGSVEADGLVRDGTCYRNALFGSSPVTLRLSVSTSVGSIRLEAAR